MHALESVLLVLSRSALAFGGGVVVAVRLGGRGSAKARERAFKQGPRCRYRTCGGRVG